MNKPSVKTLEKAFPGKGKSLRELLDSNIAVRNHPAVVAWIGDCYNMPKLHELRMYALDAVLENFGVEYVRVGSNAKSPGFYYSNAGYTYAATICRVSGRYIVSDIGTLIERGNYE